MLGAVERQPQAASLDLTTIYEEERMGRYMANLSDEDYLTGAFSAKSCPGVYLFLGMEE